MRHHTTFGHNRFSLDAPCPSPHHLPRDPPLRRDARSDRTFLYPRCSRAATGVRGMKTMQNERPSVRRFSTTSGRCATVTYGSSCEHASRRTPRVAGCQPTDSRCALDGVEHAVGRLGFRVGTTPSRSSSTPATSGYEVSPAFRGKRLGGTIVSAGTAARSVAMAFRSCGSPAIRTTGRRDGRASDSAPSWSTSSTYHATATYSRLAVSANVATFSRYDSHCRPAVTPLSITH